MFNNYRHILNHQYTKKIAWSCIIFDMNFEGVCSENYFRRLLLTFQMGVEANFFVSTEHSNDNPYDASNSWVEHPPAHHGAHSDKHSVRLCTRELQNFDGYHEGMSFVSFLVLLIL